MKKKIGLGVLILFLLIINSVNAQFVHPGLTNKLSDLDRVKYMIEAKIDPWYSSYQEMLSDSKSSYNYTVRGDQSFTVLGRDDGTNYNAWNDDIRAAYYNALQWYVTGDSRHAEKSIEIFNAWKNLQDVTSGGTRALSGAVVYIMLEAAEIIKSTYTGWSASDIQDFKDMLVYPGYSTTAEPAGISRTSGSFYWQAYQGDSVRHGNQGLSGFRAVMAMGIFMDNEIMYERALRYLQGLPHRSDDLPYPAGPPQATTISKEGDYEDTYNYTVGTSIEDFGYNEVITNYIYENGQCQESSRDQQHTVFGLGNICAMAEMAWNQGDDIYSHENDRLLLGLEYTMRYNVSYLRPSTYSDQSGWWVPTVESGEFNDRFNASQRVKAKMISPTHVGGYVGVRPVLEMPLAHYYGRGFKTSEEVKWTERGRNVSIEETGYEGAGHQNGAIGWGALMSRRPDGCYGEPISGFDSNGLPSYNMNVFPGTIEAEHFDYSPVSGEGRTYHDTSESNSGNVYRINESVDVDSETTGNYYITNIEDGEWLTYTVYIPETQKYNISMRYASDNALGTVKLLFGGEDKTGFVSVPSTGGVQTWGDLVFSEEIVLTKGVQSLKLLIGKGNFNIDNLTIAMSNAQEIGDVFILDDIQYKISNLEPNEVEVIGSSLTELLIPTVALDPATSISYSVTSIAVDAFKDDTTINSLTLPNTLRTIGAGAFGNCTELAIAPLDLTNVTTVGAYAFLNCTLVTSVIVPEGITLEVGALRATGLTSFTIPASFSTLPDQMIRDCKSITSINIPSTVEVMGVASFRGCTGITDMQVNWKTTEAIADGTVGNLFNGLTLSEVNLLVPADTEILFEAAEVWKDFNIVEGTLSVDTLEKDLNINIYPNPTNGIVYLKGERNENIELMILDISGRVLSSTKGTEIDLSNLSPGIYILKGKTNKGVFTKRILKE